MEYSKFQYPDAQATVWKLSGKHAKLRGLGLLGLF